MEEPTKKICGLFRGSGDDRQAQSSPDCTSDGIGERAGHGCIETVAWVEHAGKTLVLRGSRFCNQRPTSRRSAFRKSAYYIGV